MEDWRLIVDPPSDGAENMATDEALLLSSASGDWAGPVLRLYGWRTPTISIGYLQDAAPLLEAGLPVVRRITGGRAVLHDSEITYSVVASSVGEKFSGGVTAVYSAISRCIVAALKDAGVDARFSAAMKGGSYRKSAACFSTYTRHEILAGKGKISGSSQRRLKDSFLQHGSIIFNIDRPLTASVFGESVLERTACVSDFGEIGPGELRQYLVRRISDGLNAFFTPAVLSEAERALREKLLQSKYSSSGWNLNHRTPRKAASFSTESRFSSSRG
ncbi:MAG: biotin/lipoate A/B protein ligase family protein [Thermodesulfobacteriota bacterium]